MVFFAQYVGWTKKERALKIPLLRLMRALDLIYFKSESFFATKRALANLINGLKINFPFSKFGTIISTFQYPYTVIPR